MIIRNVRTTYLVFLPFAFSVADPRDVPDWAFAWAFFFVFCVPFLAGVFRAFVLVVLLLERLGGIVGGSGVRQVWGDVSQCATPKAFTRERPTSTCNIELALE